VHKLNILLNGIDHEEVLGDPGIEVVNLESDSRKISPGSMFIAIRGTANDGHEFIDSAVSDGAVAVVCETLPDNISNNVSYIRVRDSSRFLGMVASAFWGHPSCKLKLTGITGTNGKTTTATLLYRLFKGLGRKSGLISTISYFVNDRKLPATHTTPDPLTINRLLYEMVQDGCQYCFIEVSSHAIVQQRIGGLSFTGGIFTNISHDHLDYHKSYDEYLRVKKQFFDELGNDAFALVNKDDRNADFMVQNTRAG
jgi:UDP-N-acetylmuramoyl-L-alanyl-D-glutamate--2,6-diaminopimelate ligase